MTKTNKLTAKTAKPAAKAKAVAVETKSARIDTATPAQVREWWPADRAKRILALTGEGLPYWRAVRRSRRHMIEKGVW